MGTAVRPPPAPTTDRTRARRDPFLSNINPAHAQHSTLPLTAHSLHITHRRPSCPPPRSANIANLRELGGWAGGKECGRLRPRTGARNLAVSGSERAVRERCRIHACVGVSVSYGLFVAVSVTAMVYNICVECILAAPNKHYNIYNTKSTMPARIADSGSCFLYFAKRSDRMRFERTRRQAFRSTETLMVAFLYQWLWKPLTKHDCRLRQCCWGHMGCAALRSTCVLRVTTHFGPYGASRTNRTRAGSTRSRNGLGCSGIIVPAM